MEAGKERADLSLMLVMIYSSLKSKIFFESKTNYLGEVCPLVVFLPSCYLVEHILYLVRMQLEPLVNPLAILLIPLKYR